MPNISVDRARLAQIDERLKTVARPALERTLMRAAPIAQRQASTDAPRSTGALSRSIVADVRGLQARVYSPLRYALPAEFGRRPGAPMPPIAAFSRYGTAAFAVARAISQRGVKGRFFLKRARERMQTVELPRLLLQAGQEIGDAWSRS